MADYYTLRQLALKVGISEVQIAELESKGLLHPKLKNGKRFFSSRQAHASRGGPATRSETESKFWAGVSARGGNASLPSEHEY